MNGKPATTRPDVVQPMKTKRPQRDDPRRREVNVLKAKREATAPRPTAVTAATPAAPPSAAPKSAICQIDWWRGYVKSQFYAWTWDGEGKESILLTSPPFRWSKSTPPPQTLPHVAEAHAALVAQLKAKGWVTTYRGRQWYALQLERRQAATTAGAERTS